MTKKRTAVQPINAAILARVSTTGQKDNSSLEGQLNTCREYCDSRDYIVVSEKKEVMSGAFVLARSGFAELLDMAANGLIQVIVVDVPDRLGRGDAIAKLEYMAELNGARIEYVRGVNDTSTIEGIVLDSADKMLSGIERHMIKRRTMDGRKDRIAEGRIIAPPNRPYGYRIINERDQRGRKVSCTLEVVETEARIIRDIYDWCVYEGMTSNAIARRLNDRQIPRMSDTDAETKRWYLTLTKERTRFAGWCRTQVVSILRNPLYRGQWRYSKKSTQRIDTVGKVKHKVTRKAADDASILTVAVPAIVPVELWQAAQEQLEENKRKFMHPPINDYVLRGRIRCGTCERAMNGHGIKYKTTTTRYYECRYSKSSVGTCPSKVRYLRADNAEAAVWKSIRDVMQESDRLWLGVRKNNEANQQARRMLEQAIAAEQAEIDKINKKKERLLDLYESKGISKEKYFARLAEHQAEIDKHTKEKERIMERMGECAVLTPEQEMTLQRFQHEIAARMTDDVPAVDRMQLYDLLRVQCFYNSNTDDLLITGLFGETTVHEIDKQSRFR
jgi:site-specific DNA recombinase